jgi:hypothetical protein
MPIDTILINEVRGHSIAFWTDIQHLHDFGEFYDDDNKCFKKKVSEVDN